METITPWLERKDLLIPLSGTRMTADAIPAAVAPLIQAQLDRAAQTGWEVDGPTDVMTLWRAGRLDCREHATFWTGGRTYSLTLVTIRLRRRSTTATAVARS